LSKTRGSNSSKKEKGAIIYEDLEHSTYKYEKDGSYVQNTNAESKGTKSKGNVSMSKDIISTSKDMVGHRSVDNSSINPITTKSQKTDKKGPQEDDGFMSPWKSNIDTPNLYLVKKE